MVLVPRQVLWLPLFLLSVSEVSARPCVNVFEGLRSGLWSTVRTFDYDTFLAEKQRWQDLLPGESGEGAQRTLAELNSHPQEGVRPEALLALMDHLNPEAPRTFETILKDLRNQGIQVRFRSSKENAPVSAEGPRRGWKFQRVLEIAASDKPITDIKDLYRRLYQMSLALGSVRQRQLSTRSSWFPNYSRQLFDGIEQGDQRAYATVHGWEKAFGPVPEPLAKADVRDWTLGYYGMPLRLVPRLLLFPGINPTKGHVPNENGYALYKKDLEGWNLLRQSIERRFGPRAAAKYVADTYGRLLKASALAGFSYGAMMLSIELLSGEISQDFDRSAALFSMMTGFDDDEDPASLPPSPAMLEYFEKRIAAIQRDIAQNGATPEKEAELNFQMTQREFYARQTVAGGP